MTLERAISVIGVAVILGGILILGSAVTAAKLSALGSSATDAAILGAEKIDATGWTSADWTGTYPYTHTTGNTTALSRAISGMANGTYWQIVITIASRTAGSIDATIGGSAAYHYSGEVAGNNSYTFGVKAVGTGALTFTYACEEDKS